MATAGGSSSPPPPGCLLLAFCLAVMGADALLLESPVQPAAQHDGTAAAAAGAAAAAAAAAAGADTSRHYSLGVRTGAGAGSSAIAERRSRRGSLALWRRTAANRHLTCRGFGEGDGGAGSPYVVVYVFSGRREKMKLLLKYLDVLLLTGRLKEVHLWDVTKNDEDQKFINEQKGRDGYTVSNRSNWTEAYGFYGPGGGFEPQCEGATPNSTVLVKSDDDIVFLDLDRFPSFAQFVQEHPEMFLVQANVINNNVAGFVQGQYNEKIKNLSDALPSVFKWAEPGEPGSGRGARESQEDAMEWHQMFTENPSDFSWEEPSANNCIVYRSPYTKAPGQPRFSINFFGARQTAFDEVNRLIASDDDDERALTILATRKNLTECMFTPFNVAHLSFNVQRKADSALPLYVKLWEKRHEQYQQEELQQRGEQRPQRDADGQQQQQD